MGKRGRRRSSNGSKPNTSPLASKKQKNGTPKSAGIQRENNSAPSAFTDNNHQRQEDEISLRTIVSKNRFSTGGTAINDSDLDGFGDDQDLPPAPPQEQQTKACKLPPLMVKSLNLDQLKQAMAAVNVKAAYKMCRIGIKVVLSTKQDYETAKKHLDRSKVEFFTFDMPSEKPFKAVIHGLPVMDVEDIKSELVFRYKLKPLAVYPMTRHNRDTEFRDCLYLVHFPKGSVTLGALNAATMIQDLIVYWKGYRGANKDVTQCMRCLNYGHGTRNCRLKSRCNICAQGHPTDSCPVEGAVAYKCVNCGGAHRSSDRNCPKRDEYKQIRKQASTTNQPGRKRDREPLFDPEDFPDLCPGNRIQPDATAHQNRWLPPPTHSQAAQRRFLPPNRQQDHRPQAQRTTSPECPPGFRRPSQPCDQTSREHCSAEGSPRLYTAADLQHILNEMCDKLQQCNTRLEQVRVIGNLVLTYGY